MEIRSLTCRPVFLFYAGKFLVAVNYGTSGNISDASLTHCCSTYTAGTGLGHIQQRSVVNTGIRINMDTALTFTLVCFELGLQLPVGDSTHYIRGQGR